MCERKWCGPGNDVLYEAIWDLFKMALGKTREDHPATFLMTGAQKSLWAGSAFADLFETNNHVSEELCQRRLPDRCKTIAWDDLLRGGDANTQNTSQRKSRPSQLAGRQSAMWNYAQYVSGPSPTI